MEQLPRRAEPPAEPRVPIRRTEFRGVHRNLSDRVEGAILRVITLGAVILGLVQLLHLSPTASRWLNLAERLEGVPAGEVEAWSPKIEVTVTAKPAAPGATLLVAGKPVGTFAKGSLTVAVSPGQSLAVDTTGTAGAVTFQVSGPADLASPPPGVPVRVQGRAQPLGVVLTRP